MAMISVIMSIYNEPIEWIRQSIDSVLYQTYTDFDFIIINDKPDRAENISILDRYASKDARIVIINNEQNIGLTKSLNRGLEVAKGEYIARMDADDISRPERFEKQLAFLESHNECQVCFSSANYISEEGFPLKKKKQKFITEDLFIQNVMIHPSVMFSKSLLPLRSPVYNEEYRRSQDYELWTFWYLNNINLGVMEDALLYYRISDKQISTVNFLEQLSDFHNIRRNFIQTFLQKKGYKSSIDEEDNLIYELESRSHTSQKADKSIISRIYFLLYFKKCRRKPILVLHYINHSLRWGMIVNLRYMKCFILSCLRIKEYPLFDL